MNNGGGFDVIGWCFIWPILWLIVVSLSKPKRIRRTRSRRHAYFPPYYYHPHHHHNHFGRGWW